MKKIAVIFNTDKIGGAERSLIEQLKLVSEQNDFHFFIPDLSNRNSEFTEHLDRLSQNPLIRFYYPMILYRISRKMSLPVFAMVYFIPMLLLASIKWRKKFSRFNEFYVNGNKAIIPIIATILFSKKNRKVYWHFRDYPNSTYIRWLSNFLKISRPFIVNVKFIYIANSESVQKELCHYFNRENVTMIYNLPGKLPRRNIKSIKIIGVASMHAPWKGIHEILMMASLYKKELERIGIEKILIYGENIYQTNNSENKYSQELHNLSKKLKLTNVVWRGYESPEVIFSESDLLLHSSLTAEPFGRVITEAFKAGIPVISTALGGAHELVFDSKTGFRYLPQDYSGLFEKINEIVTNSVIRDVIILDSYTFVKSLEIEVEKNIRRILD